MSAYRKFQEKEIAHTLAPFPLITPYFFRNPLLFLMAPNRLAHLPFLFFDGNRAQEGAWHRLS